MNGQKCTCGYCDSCLSDVATVQPPSYAQKCDECEATGYHKDWCSRR